MEENATAEPEGLRGQARTRVISWPYLSQPGSQGEGAGRQIEWWQERWGVLDEASVKCPWVPWSYCYLCFCCMLSGSVVSDSVTPWTVARQAPLSMGFSRQEYWSGLLFPFPGDLPDPGTEPGSAALQANSTDWAMRDCHSNHYVVSNKEIPGPLKIRALNLPSCLLGHEIPSLAWLITAPCPPKGEGSEILQ